MDRESNDNLSASPLDAISRSRRSGGTLFMNIHDERNAMSAAAIRIHTVAIRRTEEFFAGEPVEKHIWIKRFQKFRRQVSGL